MVRVSRCGLTLTDQATPQDAPVAVLDGTSPSAVWCDLADALEPAIRDAVRDLLARDGTTHHVNRADRLVAAGVSVVDEPTTHAVATVFAGFDRALETDAYEAAQSLLGAFGQQGAAEPLGWHLPLEAVDEGPLALLDVLEDSPTVPIRLREAFFEQRADQRRALCRLLAALAGVAEVRVLATGRQQRKLAELHRADLPGVSDGCSTPRVETPPAARVEAARQALDPDGRPVALLRRLAAEPSGTLAYSELYAEALVGKSRVRQTVGTLRELGLVATFGAQSARMVELLTAGAKYLADLDRQQTLSEVVSETGKPPQQAVLSRKHGGGDRSAGEGAAGAGPVATDAGPYRTAYLGRADHAAAAGAAAPGAVTLVSDRLGAAPDAPDHTRYVSYDGSRREGVVAVRATTPMQYAVSLATALASPRFLDRALPVSRLASVLEEPPAVLRDARCIGGLSEEVFEDPAVLRETLVEWRETLEEMTTDLKHGEYEDRDRLRQEILRSAHGLAGSVAHLLDAADIELVREVRVPAGLGEEQHAALARSVAVSAAIQSRYGAFAAYRQLYEERDEKRSASLSPEVDATDPFASLAGSFVVRGPDIHRLRPQLETRLGTPADLHEDAPEFAVEVPVQEAGRGAVATAVSRLLDRKRLRPTRAAVSVLHGLTASVYEAARAVQELGEAHTPREIRSDELRYALSKLDADALLPEATPTVRAVVATLLEAEGRLSQGELADRAGVSTRSVRNNRAALVALGLVDVEAGPDGGGWRLTLSFRTAEERRGEGILPTPVATATSFADVVDDLAAALLSPDEYIGEVFDLLLWPPDPWAVAEDPRLEPWVSIAAALVEADPPSGDSVVRMGPSIEQAALPSEALKHDATLG